MKWVWLGWAAMADVAQTLARIAVTNCKRFMQIDSLGEAAVASVDGKSPSRWRNAQRLTLVDSVGNKGRKYTPKRRSRGVLPSTPERRRDNRFPCGAARRIRDLRHMSPCGAAFATEDAEQCEFSEILPATFNATFHPWN
jgi:hypothetical protein